MGSRSRKSRWSSHVLGSNSTGQDATAHPQGSGRGADALDLEWQGIWAGGIASSVGSPVPVVDAPLRWSRRRWGRPMPGLVVHPALEEPSRVRRTGVAPACTLRLPRRSFPTMTTGLMSREHFDESDRAGREQKGLAPIPWQKRMLDVAQAKDLVGEEA